MNVSPLPLYLPEFDMVKNGMGMVSVVGGDRGTMFTLGKRRVRHNRIVKRAAAVARRREGRRICEQIERPLAECNYCGKAVILPLHRGMCPSCGKAEEEFYHNYVEDYDQPCNYGYDANGNYMS